MERETLTQNFRKQIVRRITRSFLDILILRLIQTEPMWGYKIIKKIERLFRMKIRHGALYPLLNSMEANGYVRSKRTYNGGRVKKVYEITSKGTQLVDAYYDFLKKQLQRLDIKEV